MMLGETLSEQLFIYCERGLEAGPLAEPLNAASNVGFLIAATLALRRLVLARRAGAFAAAGDPGLAAIVAMIVLTVLIAAGSSLFHVLATRWAQAADVVPIALFMLLYLVFALRAFVRLGWDRVAACVALFALGAGAAALACPSAAVAGARGACLNGTLAYVPALAALAGIGMVLRARRHPVACPLLAAAALFALSMTARSLDLAACDAVRLDGHRMGLHALWHLINAAVLYLLLIAAMRPGPRPAPRLRPRCQPQSNDA